MSDDSEQSDEILALKSIYGDKVILCDTEMKPLQGRMVVDVDARQVFEEGDFRVCLDNNHDALVLFKHLNPITLTFQLPPDYPSKSPPSFSLNIYWLSQQQTATLTSHLTHLWNDQSNSVILFTWFNFLQNEALKHLNIHTSIPLPQDRILKLTEYNAIKEEREFKRSIQLCPVCFTDKPGSQCQRLINCGHIFCNTCLTDYMQLGITEGGVTSIRCMLHECSAEINPANVKSVVSDALYGRYDRLLLQKSLDGMSDVQYCPRQHCRCAVIIDREHNLGSCQECGFSFCTCCRCTYHGLEKCKFQIDDMNKYMKGTEEEKESLRQRYGKQKITDMVEYFQSINLIQESTVKCPKCQRCIEKTDGCNKMTCSQCNTFFCWMCGVMLDRKNPYGHYGDKESKCYNKLFLGLLMDPLEDDFLIDLMRDGEDGD